MSEQTKAERSDRRDSDRRRNTEIDFGVAERRKGERRAAATRKN